ncbi:MAG TPA: Wadjet anti-phage system protein JetD domain-containing protein [Ktedonobacteraceae bacterium]|nr:Wadjet anti-phage system protein JetD domain-containing protein [Ktedonobacteraceae bacterium]
MITPAEIRQKAARLYPVFLRAWLQTEAFFPLTFPVGKLPTDYLELRKWARDLQAQSKEQRDSGYTLEYEVQQKRFSGEQTLPARVVIETEQDYLRLVEKQAEFVAYRQDVTLIRELLPQLEAWMQRYPQRVVEHHVDWVGLLAMCRYFLEHPRPRVYIRELPINVHTKFIEQHRGIARELLEQILPPEAMTDAAETFEQRFGLREKEPVVRARFLDGQLDRRYGLPITELSLPTSQFAALDLLRGQRCIVTENEMTFLTLPPRQESFALFGGGFMVRNLARVPWLADCPISYWGDLDAQGFQILSSLRSIFPHVTSLMMDWETLSTFAEFTVTSIPCPVQQLPHLTPDEHDLFTHLAEHCLRLEQERISHSYALERISR